MPVTDFDDPSWTPSTRPTEAGSRRRIPVIRICVAIVVVTIVAIIAIKTMGGRSAAPADTTAPPVPAPGQPAAPPPAPSGVPRPETAVVEIVSGLWRGSATMTSSDSLHGIPIGWPRSTDGAIGAALASRVFVFSSAGLVESTRPVLAERLFTPDGKGEAGTAEQAANVRKSYRLNDQGQVLDAQSGRISDTERFVAVAMPRYGAYQVDHIGYGADQLPNEARVRTWVPVAAGIADGTDQSGVTLNWQSALVTLRWWENDWRVAHTEVLPKVLPAQRNKSNQGFDQRREALGPGWVVLADATEKPYTGAERTR